MLFCCVFLCFFIQICRGNPSLLGMGRGGANAINLAGASFQINPTHPGYGGISAVTGKNLHIDVDKLDLSVSHGVLTLSRNAFNFTRGQGNWVTEYFDERLEMVRNNRSIMQIVASNRLDLYQMKFIGVGHFSDVTLDKTLSQPIMVSFCKAERKAVGKSVRDIDACALDMSKQHFSQIQLFEQLGKILFSITDAKYASTEEVHNRLKGSYEAAVETVVREFNQELATVKTSRTEFLAWQEKQKESLSSLSDVQTVVQTFKDELQSNLIFVEDRQEELSNALRASIDDIALNITEAEVRILEILNDSLSIAVANVTNNNREYVDTKVETIKADMKSIEINLNHAVLSLSTLNEEKSGMQIAFNQSLENIIDSAVFLNNSLHHEIDYITLQMNNMTEKMTDIGRQIGDDLNDKLLNLTNAVNITSAELQRLALLQNKSHYLLSDSITSLNNIIYSNIEEVRNFTTDSVDWLMNKTATNYTYIIQAIRLLNTSLDEKADALTNTTHMLHSLINASDLSSKNMINEAVNNISISLAHSNGIFAKFIKELNTTISIVNDNHIALHTIMLPAKIEETYNKSSLDLQLASDSLSSSFFTALAESQSKTNQHIQDVQANLTSDLRLGLEGTNESLSKLMEKHNRDTITWHEALLEQDKNQTIFLLTLEENILIDLQTLNNSLQNHTSSLLQKCDRLNDSNTEKLMILNAAINSNLTLLEQKIQNHSHLTSSQFMTLNNVSSQVYANISKTMAEIQHQSYENVSILHDLLMQELVQESTNRLADSKKTTANIMNLNDSLFSFVGNALEITLNNTDRVKVLLEKSISKLKEEQDQVVGALSNELNKVNDTITQQAMANLSILENKLKGNLSRLEDNIEALERNISSALGDTMRKGQLAVQATSDQLFAALNSSNSLREQQVELLQDSINTLYTSTERNFSALIDQMIFENDHMMTTLSKSNEQHSKGLNTLNSGVNVLNNSLSAMYVALDEKIIGLQYGTDKNISHTWDLLQSLNTSHTLLAANSNDALLLLNKEHQINFNHLLELLTKTNISQEFHYNTLSTALSATDVKFDSMLNKTRTDMVVMNNELKSSISYINEQAYSNITILNKTIHSELDRVVSGLLLEQKKSVEQLETKIIDHSAVIGDSIFDLAKQLNQSVYDNSHAHEQMHQLQRLNFLQTNEKIVVLQHNLSSLEGNILLQYQEDLVDREGLKTNLSSIIRVFESDVSQLLHTAEVKTNMTLLEQQVLLAGQTERLSFLQEVVNDVKQAHSMLQQNVVEQGNSIVEYKTSHEYHKASMSNMQSKVDQLAEAYPIITADIAVTQTELKSLQNSQEISQAQYLQIINDQLQQAANMSMVSGKLQNEIETRKEQHDMLRSYFTQQLNESTSSTSAGLFDLKHSDIRQNDVIATLSGQASALLTASEGHTKDINNLKNQAVKCEASQIEVAQLKEDVKSLQGQLQEKDNLYRKEIEELSSSFSSAMEMIRRLQEQMQRHEQSINEVGRDHLVMKTTVAQKNDVDALKSKLADLQQGSLLQASNALQLVQNFYQQPK